MKVIKTKGTTNTTSNLDLLADSVDAVAVGENNVALHLKSMKWLHINIENKCASFRERLSDVGFSKECTGRHTGRVNVNVFVGTGNDARYSKFALGTIVAFIKDTVERGGVYRVSYALLEGAHIDGSGSCAYGLTENIALDNMELIDANSNKLQYQAFVKCLKLGYWISLSGIHNIPLITYIISKEWNKDVEDLIDKFSLQKRVVNNKINYYSE